MKFLRSFVAIACAAAAVGAKAEAPTVNIGYQYGLSYVVFHVMEKQNLVEKHAKAAGIDLKAEYRNMGSPGTMRDSMIAGQTDFGAIGVPALATMADKTNGEFKAAANIVSVPMILNTTEDVKSICDLKGKIAMTTIKSSVYAIALQMAAKQKCGDPFALDANTVSMTNPDGMAALLNGQVSSHYSAAPFSDLEIKGGKGKIKTILNSYDTMGGPAALIVLAGKDSYRVANPKVFAAVVGALEEASKWVKEHKKEAAELYIQEERSKESVEAVTAQLSSPDVIFDTTPKQIGAYSKFMKEIGTVKKEMDWKFLSMPNLHGRNGS